MEGLKAILQRFTGRTDQEGSLEAKNKDDSLGYDAKELQVADKIVKAVRDAEKVSHELRNRVEGIIGEMGWTQNLALAVLARVEDAVHTGISKVGALKEAFDKATEAAVGFACEHPVYATVIALGILVILFPWMIEALGFGFEGPLEGSFAAFWQSRYAGYVPKGSLFSFFQRLGMVWRSGKPIVLIGKVGVLGSSKL